MGRGYLVPTRKLCEVCSRPLMYEKAYLYVHKGHPYLFCEPNEKYRCFFEWYSMERRKE